MHHPRTLQKIPWQKLLHRYTHAMRTRAQNRNFKPNQILDGTIRYPISRALLTTITS
jgi:hypothetical protein